MNKQDEEKAKEIASMTWSDFEESKKQSLNIGKYIQDACLDMSAWKEHQMIEKVKEFIATWFYEHPHTSWLICSDEFQDLDDCLERLEKEMKEEN